MHFKGRVKVFEAIIIQKYFSSRRQNISNAYKTVFRIKYFIYILKLSSRVKPIYIQYQLSETYIEILNIMFPHQMPKQILSVIVRIVSS